MDEIHVLRRREHKEADNCKCRSSKCGHPRVVRMLYIVSHRPNGSNSRRTVPNLSPRTIAEILSNMPGVAIEIIQAQIVIRTDTEWAWHDFRDRILDPLILKAGWDLSCPITFK